MTIRNRSTLLAHGNREGRRRVLDVLESGLQATDPYPNAKKLLQVDGDHLTIEHCDVPVHDAEGRSVAASTVTFHRAELGNIYVVGGGKAAQRMAKAIEDVLGDWITDGHVCAEKR